MVIHIQPTVFQIMLAHVQSGLPLEACGLLAGQDNFISHIYIIDNILRSPVAFEMDAQQQIEAMLNVEAQGLELIAIYHSHPQGPQAPSQTDIAKAYYPELAQIIVSLLKSQPAANGL
jgi:proteasome lid subunit RPN8/RPN11